MHENAELLTLLSSSLAPPSSPSPGSCVLVLSFSPFSHDVSVPLSKRFSRSRSRPILSRSFVLRPDLSLTDSPLLPLISISIPLAETGVSLSAPIWNFFADVIERRSRRSSRSTDVENARRILPLPRCRFAEDRREIENRSTRVDFQV